VELLASEGGAHPDRLRRRRSRSGRPSSADPAGGGWSQGDGRGPRSGHLRRRIRDPPGSFLQHDVAAAPNTKLETILGPRATVCSHHHQGLRRLGDGLVAAATAEDGGIEAIEVADAGFVLGVLWHPEAGDDLALFSALVESAATSIRERSIA
jgi:gamma-glutamyl-gamma-aminobutyrate hydrolase PuuD